MYIEPNTDIYILHNVPLDTTYDHTIWFASVSDQSTYFISKRKYTLSDYTYQRVKRGYMRVGINSNNLYDCNYLMFRNTNFGSKWFYAYIKSVEYVNNDVSEIEFEIDDMQTWFFDYSLDECFVEREHSATDNIGDNIVPEPVDIGEYVRNTQDHVIDSEAQAYGSGFTYGYAKMFPYSYHLDPTKDKRMVMIQVVETNGASSDGALVYGIFSGAKYYWFKAETNADIATINAFLGNYISDPDSIINMYMVSSALIYGEPPSDGNYNGSSTTDTFHGLKYITSDSHVISGTYYPFPVSFSPISDAITLDGYLPRNKKLYTYPFNFFEVDDGQGKNNIYRYEFFNNGLDATDINLTPQFVVYTCAVSPAKVVIMPINYKGICAGSPSYDEQLELNAFPSCSWNADYYKMYLSQNFKADIIRAGGNLIGGSLLSPLVGAKNAIESASNSLANYYTASQKADIAKGNFNNGDVLFSNREYGIRGGRMCVNKNNARIIDGFFDKFGYATNLLKVPNTHARARWCYTKTVACTISGSIPSDSAKHICEIYNNGVTFWRNGQTVCDYSNPETNIPNGEVGD